ncbi:hypothetical protein ACLB2K_067781 [Fragaria x ananassa]
MDSPGRVVIQESKKGYELYKLQRDVIAVVTDQGLKKLDKKKKMRELLNPVPQPVFDQWLEIARLVREYRTETQTEEHGWNEFLLSKLKSIEVLANEDRRLIHPVSYRVKKYRVLKRDFLRERARLEAKYQNWFRDLYKERFENVNGEVREPNTKGGVPEFWLKAMKNNEVLAEEITERDEGALKYLQDLEWRRPKSSEINWRHGKSLTHKLIEKPGKKGKPMSKTCESFFNFFTSHSVPHPSEDTYPYTPGEATVEGFKAQLRYDFYIGKIIRDKIIPHAIAWFTKEALQKSSEFHDLEDLYYDGYSEDDMDECNGDEDDDE